MTKNGGGRNEEGRICELNYYSLWTPTAAAKDDNHGNERNEKHEEILSNQTERGTCQKKKKDFFV
jgi:hypothetical protein